MKDKICETIKNKKIIKIIYKSHERIIEPHLLGKKTSGKDALSAWQVGGYSESGDLPAWRNYSMDKIESITVLDESFEGPRPGYNPDDKTMDEIYCRI